MQITKLSCFKIWRWMAMNFNHRQKKVHFCERFYAEINGSISQSQTSILSSPVASFCRILSLFKRHLLLFLFISCPYILYLHLVSVPFLHVKAQKRFPFNVHPTKSNLCHVKPKSNHLKLLKPPKKLLKEIHLSFALLRYYVNHSFEPKYELLFYFSSANPSLYNIKSAL